MTPDEAESKQSVTAGLGLPSGRSNQMLTDVTTNQFSAYLFKLQTPELDKLEVVLLQKTQTCQVLALKFSILFTNVELNTSQVGGCSKH